MTAAGFCRVTVVVPHGRVDVALPTDVPVAELTPMVLELVGMPAVPRGRGPVPWRLGGTAGGVLPPGASLAELEVLDGELLRLAPALSPPPPPVFADLPDAVADAVSRAARRADARVLPLAGLAALVLVAAVLGGLRGAGTVTEVGAALVGAGGAAGLLALARHRVASGREATAGATDGTAPASRFGEVSCALAAVALAAAAGSVALPGAPPAASTLLAAVGAGLAAATGQAFVRIVAPVLLAALAGAWMVALAAAAVLVARVPVPDVAAAVACGAALVGPLLPGLALRLAGLAPATEADHGDAVALARGHLAGLVLGTAGTGGAAAVVAASGPGWAAPAAGCTACLVLLLRSRGVAEPLPAGALQVAGLLGLVAAALAASPAPGVRLVVGTGVLAAVAGRVLAGARRPDPGPVARRVADLAELVLTAACVPLALAALGAFGLVRGW